MKKFNLKPDTMLRLQKEFERFQEARRIVRKNIPKYIKDFQEFQGDREDRKEFLEREYLPKSPNLNSLISEGQDSKNFLWHVEDIINITGLMQSSISKILNKMKASEEWAARLLALEVETKSANNNKIFVYHEEIFDLIIDYQESKCLERFLKPRRGTAQDPEEILRFWNYLKNAEVFGIVREVRDTPEILPDLPPLSTENIFSLIFRKIITAKIFTVATIIFAVCFGLIKRWNFLLPVFVGGALLVLGVSFLFLKSRKGKAGLISDIGAVAMLTGIFWSAGLFSDGVIFSPAGTALSINNERSIKLQPELEKKHKLSFRIKFDSYDDLKEISYRENEQDEFISTGFNDFKFPLLIIEPKDQSAPEIFLEIKYKDSKGNEQGPFKFSFDREKTRYELSKDFIINRQNAWLYLRRFAGVTTLKFFCDLNYADNVVDYLAYGLNTESPDKIFIPSGPGDSIVLRRRKNNIKFVSSYLMFTDGTSSDLRVTKIK